MAGAIRSQYPSELAPLFDDLDRMKARIKELETSRNTAASSDTIVTRTSPNGTIWRLDVSDAGATVWTAI
jgi:hypothetical protein